MAAPITHPSRGRIMIFYHVHAVNNWKWVVQDQLSKLIYSGLYNYATEARSAPWLWLDPSPCVPHACGRSISRSSVLGQPSVTAESVATCSACCWPHHDVMVPLSCCLRAVIGRVHGQITAAAPQADATLLCRLCRW